MVQKTATQTQSVPVPTPKFDWKKIAKWTGMGLAAVLLLVAGFAAAKFFQKGDSPQSQNQPQAQQNNTGPAGFVPAVAPEPKKKAPVPLMAALGTKENPVPVGTPLARQVPSFIGADQELTVLESRISRRNEANIKVRVIEIKIAVRTLQEKRTSFNGQDFYLMGTANGKTYESRAPLKTVLPGTTLATIQFADKEENFSSDEFFLVWSPIYDDRPVYFALGEIK